MPAHLDDASRFDVVMDATGVIAAIEDGLRRVRPGGTFLQFGVASLPGHGQRLALQDLQRRDNRNWFNGRFEEL